MAARTKRASSRKTAAKKASAKKASARKPAKKKIATKPAITIPRLRVSMPLDKDKVAAIRRCLAKGRLTISINRINLVTGRAGDGYLYD